jgi:hypothetical protein
MPCQRYLVRAFHEATGLVELGTTVFFGGKTDKVTRKVITLLIRAQYYGCAKVHKDNIIKILIVFKADKYVLWFYI